MSTTDSLNASCSALRHKLFSLKSFLPYKELLDTPEDAVTCIRHLCCCGYPLCYLFNLLPEESFPKIDIDFESSATEEHSIIMAITLFAMNVRRTLGCEYFTTAELLQENAAEGLQKAVQALFAVLRLLPEASFEFQSSLSSLKSSEPSYSDIGDFLNPSNQYTTQFSDDAVWKIHLRSIPHSERQYVQEIEMLENYSSRLSGHGSESVRNTINHVFHKDFFAFVRKFCIRIECAAQAPPYDQRWGRLFIENATDIQMRYTTYCVNYILAEEELAEQGAKLCEINAHTWTPELISKLLDRPFQRLSEYMRILDTLVAVSDPETTHYDELLSGRDAIKEVVEKVVISQKRARTELVMRRLENYVPEWRCNDTGLFHLKGNFLVRHNRAAPLHSEFYLFDKELILFRERPTPSSPRLGRRKTSAAAVMAPSKFMFLDPPHCILTKEIEYVTISLQNNGGSFSEAYTSNIISSSLIYELVISTSTEELVLLFQRQDMAVLWQKSIEECRAESLPLEVKDTLSAPLSSRLPSARHEMEQKVTNETTSRFTAMSIDNPTSICSEGNQPSGTGTLTVYTTNPWNGSPTLTSSKRKEVKVEKKKEAMSKYYGVYSIYMAHWK